VAAPSARGAGRASITGNRGRRFDLGFDRRQRSRRAETPSLGVPAGARPPIITRRRPLRISPPSATRAPAASGEPAAAPRELTPTPARAPSPIRRAVARPNLEWRALRETLTACGRARFRSEKSTAARDRPTPVSPPSWP
jgi:hypothetical protein